MIQTRWTFNLSEISWTILGLLGCLGMVAFEAFTMWLLVHKR